MSSDTKGTASAVPAVPTNGSPVEADQWEADALASITAVSTPEDAETLLMHVKVAEQAFAIGKLGADRERRWKQLRIRAERRYGELLPPKHQGKRHLSHAAKGDKDAEARARQVASVPQADFDDYVDSAPNPSRQGLLSSVKKTKEPPLSPKAKQRNDTGENLWEDDRVIAWLAKCLRVNPKITRTEAYAAADAGRYGWPLPGRRLTQATFDRGRAILEDRARRGDTNRPRREPKESGKRIRELHAQKRDGRTQTDLWHLQMAVAKAVAVLEGFDLPDLDWSEYTEVLVVEIYDDLARHMQWTETAIDAVVAHMDELGRRRKIQALDARASDPSSTPNERATAVRLAEVLRGKASAARLEGGA